MLDHGHPLAQHYPLGMVWVEAELVERRLNHQLASESLLMQMAVSSLFSKEAGKRYDKQIKALIED